MTIVITGVSDSVPGGEGRSFLQIATQEFIGTDNMAAKISLWRENFSFPILYSAVLVYFSSTNHSCLMKRIFTITMLLLSGTCVDAQNLHGDLENWRTYSSGTASNLELPSGWSSADSLVYVYAPMALATPQKQIAKSTSAHAGSYAAQITTRNLNGLIGTLTGILTNGTLGFDPSQFTGDPLEAITYSGGTPVSQRMSGVSAWVTYAPNGNDTATMLVEAVKNIGGKPDSVVGRGEMMITSSSSWKHVICNISYINSTIVPDTIIVGFLSSASVAPQDGSVLTVDDVDFVTVGLNDPANADARVLVYPNPARDVISFEAKESGSFIWEIYNMQGQKVGQKAFKGKGSAETVNLSNGTYSYSIYNEKGAQVQRGKFNVAK